LVLEQRVEVVVSQSELTKRNTQEKMTDREELINMVAVQAAKANRTENREDFKAYVEEFASQHHRLERYVYEDCSIRSRKMFITKAYKKAKNWL
jgi:hypothetical protein